MEEQYKGHTIQVTTDHHSRFPWKPICRIMYEGSRELIKQLDWDIGYDTPDRAEKAGMLISKKWTDAGSLISKPLVGQLGRALFGLT